MPATLIDNSLEEMERFNQIWMPSWINNGYELESYIVPGTKRYIFHNAKGDYGTLEFVPYDLENSPVNETFPFHLFQELQNKKVVEMEKLVIKEDARGSLKGLYEIFSFVVRILVEENLDYAIGLLNPRVYDTLVWRFKIPVKRLVFIGYEDLPYYPTILDIELFKQSDFGQKVINKMLVHV